MIKLEEISIAVIGLGYVGLPLALELGKKYSVIGFDINQKRINSLKKGVDYTLEASYEDISSSTHILFSNNLEDIAAQNTFIVTVPTPVDENNFPDLTHLINASSMLGPIIKAGDIVIYESTVYPGATEEVCVPILESTSKLQLNKDFYVGYSPERINPGDKENTLTKIKKITSGSSPKAAKLINELYLSIIDAGTYLAESIKVAEAAKVIENTQRDLNIAIINEFAKIFNILNIDTQQVLDAASTKWNFLKFKPGLVGGHCISVDPYYLTYKAKEVGYNPEVILAGRNINDGMGRYVGTQLVKELSKRKIHIDEANVLILGFTFKGDCPDVRNTKIIDIFKELESFSINVDVYDHWADPDEVKKEYDINLIDNLSENKYDGIILAVDHSEYKLWGSNKIRKLGKKNHVVYDLKFILPKDDSDMRL